MKQVSINTMKSLNSIEIKNDPLKVMAITYNMGEFCLNPEDKNTYKVLEDLF